MLIDAFVVFAISIWAIAINSSAFKEARGCACCCCCQESTPQAPVVLYLPVNQVITYYSKETYCKKENNPFLFNHFNYRILLDNQLNCILSIHLVQVVSTKTFDYMHLPTLGSPKKYFYLFPLGPFTGYTYNIFINAISFSLLWPINRLHINNTWHIYPNSSLSSPS